LGYREQPASAQAGRFAAIDRKRKRQTPATTKYREQLG
jgi:hypothetical protein